MVVQQAFMVSPLCLDILEYVGDVDIESSQRRFNAGCYVYAHAKSFLIERKR